VSSSPSQGAVHKQKPSSFSSMASAIGRAAARIAGVGTVATVGSGAYMYNYDEGTRRSVLFWTVAAPIYAHYRVVQWQTRDVPDVVADAEYDRLHKKYAPVVEALTLRLKGDFRPCAL
jgi:hypothetical protein